VIAVAVIVASLGVWSKNDLEQEDPVNNIKLSPRMTAVCFCDNIFFFIVVRIFSCCCG
jgi:hypothetical protein